MVCRYCVRFLIESGISWNVVKLKNYNFLVVKSLNKAMVLEKNIMEALKHIGKLML